jgi:hypothetical protein
VSARHSLLPTAADRTASAQDRRSAATTAGGYVARGFASLAADTELSTISAHVAAHNVNQTSINLATCDGVISAPAKALTP